MVLAALAAVARSENEGAGSKTHAERATHARAMLRRALLRAHRRASDEDGAATIAGLPARSLA